jgi:hypothetical protein
LADDSGWGFPKGRVAHTLRNILYPDLDDQEVEAIVVCLMAHLLIEDRLNGLLYRWLKQDAPKPNDKQVAETEEMLWKSIVKLNFAAKYSLVHPFFAAHFPNEAKTPWKINDLRNDIFHGRAIRDAKFEGQPISSEATVEKLFLAVQFASMQLETFEDMVDGPHALMEKLKDRLAELSESTQS